MFKKIISLLMAFVICLFSAPFCFADSEGNFISKTDGYWDRNLHGLINGTDGIFLLGSAIKGIASWVNKDICGYSSDGYHYADSLVSDTFVQGKQNQSYGKAICKYCGNEFLCYASDLSAAYDAYVSDLPASGYTSSGHLIWQPTLSPSRN